MKKIAICLLSLSILLFCSCITKIIYRNSLEKLESNILNASPEVEKVDILSDRGTWSMLLRLEIVFHDGRRITIDRVDDQLGGNIAIESIGNYGVTQCINAGKMNITPVKNDT
jgi:hypothetical protein